MKQITITLIFIVVFTQHVKSQADSANYIAYYNLTNKGKYYEYINKPDTAILAFLEAFKCVPKIFAFDEFHIARCYAMKKDTAQVMYWLMKSIKDGFIYKYNKETRTDSLFNFLDGRHVKIITKADEEAFQHYHYGNVIEKKWDDSVYYYFYNDGVFRSPHNNEMAHKKGEKYIDTTLKSWDQLQEKELNYLLKNGYPGLLRAPFTAIFSVPLWHLTVDRKIKLQPFLYEELKHGNITPVDYAGFYENLENGLGDHGKGNNACIYYVLKTDCPPADWSMLINNRKSIGLSIYLDQGDYIPYQMKRRGVLPWINQVINTD